MELNLYLDMDGVQGNFDLHFETLFGMHPQSIDDDTLWKLIHSTPDFFGTIPPYPGVKEFVEECQTLGFANIYNLTACPTSNYPAIAKQKVEWFIREVSPKREILTIPITGGTNKPIFMRRPGDVLVDDFSKNINAWIEKGGFGILHKDFDSTLTILKEYIELHKNEFGQSLA